MRSDLDAPGLKVRKNADGSLRYYWSASEAAARAGYKPTLVRLHGPEGGALDLENPRHREFVALRCQSLQAQMIELAGGSVAPAFDGTFGALLNRYETDPDSPFHVLSSNTQRVYRDDLRKLKAAAAGAPLAKLGAKDFKRWHRAALRPKKEGGPERVRSAHGIMVMVRIVMSYGVVEEIPHCARLRAVLAGMRFENPPPRRVRPTYAQARLMFDKAVALGAFSIAFGVALQFEGIQRQWDVAGKWERAKPGQDADIVHRGKVWIGPRWRHISDGVFRWITGKKGTPVEIDLSLYPMICEAMRLVPAGLPNAPLIVDERSGAPYLPGSYGKRFAKIARAAGLPAEIWSRDFRAGGVTEGEDSGAMMPDIAKQAAHADPNFTAKLYGRGFLEAARRVAKSRVRHRTEQS